MRRAAVTAVLLLAAASSGCGALGPSPAPLVPYDGEVTSRARAGKVGRPVHAGFTGVRARSQPVRITDVRVRGVPDGLRVVAVRALPTGPRKPMIGLLEGDLDAQEPGVYDWRPVSDLTLRPGNDPGHYFVVTVVAMRPGQFTTESIDVEWQAGGDSGTQQYAFRVSVHAS